MTAQVFLTVCTLVNYSGSVMDGQSISRTLVDLLCAIRELIAVLTTNNQALQNSPTLQMIQPEEEWLDTLDVMAIFKKSRRSIYNYCKDKQLKYKKIGGANYYLKSDVYRALND